MSKRADGLLADFLDNRWSVTSSPAAGATMTASVSVPQSANSRHNIEMFTYNIANFSAAGHTVTMNIRAGTAAASATGSVIWAQTHLIATSATAQVNIAEMGLQLAKGLGIWIHSNTVL